MKLVSNFCGDSSSFVDSCWANPYDPYSFFYGCTGMDENEEKKVWNSPDLKNYEEKSQENLSPAYFKESENPVNENGNLNENTQFTIGSFLCSM